MEGSNKEDIWPDFAYGPLTEYRKKASFDYRKMKLCIDGEEMLLYKNHIWSIFKEYDSLDDSLQTMSLDDRRRHNQRRVLILSNKLALPLSIMALKPRLHGAWCEAVFSYDVDAGASYSLGHKMFTTVVRDLGTDRHKKYIELAHNNEIVGCFALTEIAHGSNAKGIGTTAKYDAANREFVLHTPSFESAKCWIGLLGKRATHAFTYAHLITPDGINQGLHCFIVPIRCPHTLKPYRGIIAGDLGEKIGLNGVDNGFMMFDSYRIPLENLLNRFADIDENGNYATFIQNPNHRLAASFSILSMGRVQVTAITTSLMQKAIVIATRYSAVRRQFSPENSEEELPIIEYQQQQYRLIPYLAATFALRIYTNWFMEIHTIKDASMSNDIDKDLEIHGLSSAIKPIITWMTRDGIQICREACGGHGYLKVAALGELRNANDPNCTYEGENNVLIQQNSNWLLSLLKMIENGDKIETPLKSIHFLNNYYNILKEKCQCLNSREILDVKNILSTYKWLVCYLLKTTSMKVQQLLKQGNNKFTAKSKSQVFYANTLSTAFAEHAILEKFIEFIQSVNDTSCRNVLHKLASIFGAWCLEKHIGSLYMGGYYSSFEGTILRDGILDLCCDITPDVVALADTLAPPDFVLNSVLGKSDGMVYQNLQAALFSQPNVMSRPHWWREITKSTLDMSKL